MAIAVGDEERRHRERHGAGIADEEAPGRTLAPGGEQPADRQRAEQQERAQERQPNRPGHAAKLVHVLDLRILAPVPHHPDLAHRQRERAAGMRRDEGAGAPRPPRRAGVGP